MATTFGIKTSIANDNQSSQDITSNNQTPQNSPTSSGSRTILKDSYQFVIGTVAEFKATFHNNDKPTRVDSGTSPLIEVLCNGTKIGEAYGQLVDAQKYEYVFFWNIDTSLSPINTYAVKYVGQLNGGTYVFGHEYFTIRSTPSNIKLKEPAYATVQEVRLDKFNIDMYLPDYVRSDTIAKEQLIHHHLVTASEELNGQLSLRDFHTVYNKNFNLFTRYYAIWSILGQSMGEDGNAISEKTLAHWEKRWQHVLKQIKMHSQFSSIPMGRG